VLTAPKMFGRKLCLRPKKTLQRRQPLWVIRKVVFAIRICRRHAHTKKRLPRRNIPPIRRGKMLRVRSSKIETFRSLARRESMKTLRESRSLPVRRLSRPNFQSPEPRAPVPKFQAKVAFVGELPNHSIAEMLCPLARCVVLVNNCSAKFWPVIRGRTRDRRR
jgi:hypothetical protein